MEFLEACAKGDIEYIIKFIELGGDYHYNNDQGFRECCRNGHLESAKYLFACGEVDIHYNQDEAFRISYDNGHKLVAKWIYTLGDVAYVDYFDDSCDGCCSSSRDTESFSSSDDYDLED